MEKSVQAGVQIRLTIVQISSASSSQPDSRLPIQANASSFSFFLAEGCRRSKTRHIRPKIIVAIEGGEVERCVTTMNDGWIMSQ